MKNLQLLIIVILFTIMSTQSVADVKVKGYYRQDGTYVKPHHRSSPDSSHNNNWSTQGNVNPYTGKEGYLERDRDENSFQLNSDTTDIECQQQQWDSDSNPHDCTQDNVNLLSRINADNNSANQNGGVSPRTIKNRDFCNEVEGIYCPIEAKQLIGSHATVCGTIAGTYIFKKGVYLNFDNTFPKQSLTAVIWDDKISDHERNIGRSLETLVGQTICVDGKITSYNGRIDITPSNQIRIL